MLRHVNFIRMGLLIPILFSLSNGSPEKAWNLFNRVLSEEISLQKHPDSLEQAISLFRQALAKNPLDTSSAVGFVRAVLLKGNHQPIEKSKKKELYLEAKNFIHNSLQKYPNNGDIIYWYCAALGSWAQVYGVFAAAKEGVADQIKDLCEKLIKMPSQKMKARGHRILGRTHFEAPYIPFILSWPSNKAAVSNLESSLKLDPNSPTTHAYLAEALNKEGDKKQAAKILKECTKLPARVQFRLNDKKDIAKCAELLKSLKLN